MFRRHPGSHTFVSEFADGSVASGVGTALWFTQGTVLRRLALGSGELTSQLDLYTHTAVNPGHRSVAPQVLEGRGGWAFLNQGHMDGATMSASLDVMGYDLPTIAPYKSPRSLLMRFVCLAS